MKKFVICLFAAAVISLSATPVFANTTGNMRDGANGNNGVVGGLVGAAGDVVGGVVEGAENIVGGVVNGAENIVGGAGGATGGVNHNAVTHGNNGLENDRVNHGNTLTSAERDALERAQLERNPSTGAGAGFVELALIGTTMLGTAALTRKRR